MSKLNGEQIRLQIPSAPEHVVTARLVVGAVARQFGIEEETIEDLRVAVSEACNGAMNAISESNNGEITIDLEIRDERLAVDVTAKGNLPDVAPEWNPKTPTEQFQHTLGTGLMAALFEDTRWENEGDGLRISFSATLS